MAPYALTTGASHGLGLRIAQDLAQTGYRLVLVSRSQQNLDTAVRQIVEPENHITLALDLLDAAAVERLLRCLHGKDILPDTVIHNLGGPVAHDTHPIQIETLRQSLMLNLEVAVRINSSLIPLMCERGAGKIIHISSDAGLNANASPAYAIAKSALNAYVVNLARNYIKNNIMICGILPGVIEHEGSSWSMKKNENPEHYRNKLNQMPLGRFLRVDEVSEVVINLSKMNNMVVSGSLIKLNGAAL